MKKNSLTDNLALKVYTNKYLYLDYYSRLDRINHEQNNGTLFFGNISKVLFQFRLESLERVSWEQEFSFDEFLKIFYTALYLFFQRRPVVIINNLKQDKRGYNSSTIQNSLKDFSMQYSFTNKEDIYKVLLSLNIFYDNKFSLNKLITGQSCSYKIPLSEIEMLKNLINFLTEDVPIENSYVIIQLKF